MNQLTRTVPVLSYFLCAAWFMVQDEEELTDDGFDDAHQERDEGSLAETQEVVDDLSTSTLEVRRLLRRCSGNFEPPG